MLVLAAGGVLVAALVVWALTRTVETTPATTTATSIADANTSSAPAPFTPTETPAAATDGAVSAPVDPDTLAHSPATANERATVPRIAVEDVRAKMKRGEIMVVDVRDASSYQRLHIAGAVNMPLATIEAQVASLPKDKPIVTYCT